MNTYKASGIQDIDIKIFTLWSTVPVCRCQELRLALFKAVDISQLSLKLWHFLLDY